MPGVKGEERRRPYRSPLRTGMAEQTRQRVTLAALEEFLEQGYAGATIERIAARAGVSRPTVFAVGSKATLLKLARDRAIAGDDVPRRMAERADYLAVADAPDTAEALRRFARVSAGIAARFAPLNEVLREGAASDPELAQLWQTSEQERLAAARATIETLTSKGPLRAGLDPDAATDVLWLLMSPENHNRLVGERRWSFERYQEWYADTMVRLLLP